MPKLVPSFEIGLRPPSACHRPTAQPHAPRLSHALESSMHAGQTLLELLAEQKRAQQQQQQRARAAEEEEGSLHRRFGR